MDVQGPPMRFGFFDDENREYVIEKPNTPRSWTNYIGSRRYGGIVSNNAGGYSFVHSPAEGRFLRFRYNAVPADQPGRLIYLRDAKTGDFWSGSWQPVGKPLEVFQSECRFGTGYATISSQYTGICTTTRYFVPLDAEFEYWWATIQNNSQETRELDTFAFAEFTTEWNLRNDLLNLQYTMYIAEASCEEGMISASSCGRLPEDPENFANRDQSRWWWMTVKGAPVVAYDCDREKFLGNYRGFDAPEAVARGRCSNSVAYADNPCGALQSKIVLKPGESVDLIYMLGVGKADRVGRKIAAEFGTVERASREFEKLKTHWHKLLDVFQCETPDAEFDHMVNVWGHYNALMTFEWSRACSFVYTGEDRDGFGFRDTVQDILGVAASLPQDVIRERIELMLSGQESTGGARPEIQPWIHRPGQMKLTPPERYRSDDCLWFFNTIPVYVAETGDIDFYKKIIPYSDKGQATVLGHLRRALEFNLERTGRNGLPCGLSADWNDCLKLGYRGESVFVAFQVRLGLSEYARIAKDLGEETEAAWALVQRDELDERIQKVCWDGEWFIWAIGEDGTVYGSKHFPEGQTYLNSQVWAVLSGGATPEQRDKALDSVRDRLATEYGIMICDPPFEKTSVQVMRAVLMQPGCKENGGIFSHTQSWAVLAECARGNGDLAFQYYRAFMPSAYNDRAELREIEPYVHCQSTHSKASKKFGVSRVPWLSGTAAWANYTAQQGVLGIRPEPAGLAIDPCIPREWPGFKVRRVFRGKTIHIDVKNPKKLCRGVASLKVNGQPVEGCIVPEELLTDGATIEAVLG